LGFEGMEFKCVSNLCQMCVQCVSNVCPMCVQCVSIVQLSTRRYITTERWFDRHETMSQKDIQQKGHFEYWSFSFVSQIFSDSIFLPTRYFGILSVPSIPNSDCQSKTENTIIIIDIPTHHFLSADRIPNSESQVSKKTDRHLSNRHLRT
jgi:hypothetical protein